MKKAVAFLVAFVLFLGTAVGGHIWFSGKLSFHNPKFGTWINEKKFFSHEAITANLNKDSIVVYGSSELNHMRKTKYHPEKMFADQKLNVMLIGAGYYQCLFHAINLSAIDSGMEKRKVVLILSPQWFRPTGVLPEAYASRFSEDNFLAMMKNDKLSKSTKEYIIKRSEELLINDPNTLNRIKLYERIFYQQDANLGDKVFYRLYTGFLKEKENISVITSAYIKGIKHSSNSSKAPKTLDWKEYLKDAEIDGKIKTGKNKFHVKKSYYKKHLRPHLIKRKNSAVQNSYSISPEFDDLEVFLKVCKDLKIEPLVVNIPVNGWWYDYTGFPKEDRIKYAENIRQITNKYGVQLSDYSGKEYMPYFLSDTTHLGWKGWVYVNENIYNFAKENK